MATKRPLNPDAVAAADAKLAAKTGGRKLTMGPEDAALREEWIEEYKRAAGEGCDDSSKPPSNVKGTTLACGLTIYGFVGRYVYADGTGVPGATYVLKDMGDEVLDQGVTDALGRFRKTDLLTPYAHFEVHKDPNPSKYEIQPKAKAEPAKKSAAWLDDAVDWTWGTVQGDFNEDQSVSQIAVNMLLGLIPIVDQVLDARDLIANLYLLIKYYEGEAERSTEQIAKDNAEFFGLGREFGLWTNIVICAIGCFPEIGSAAKGVIKILFKEMKELLGAMTPKKLKQIFDAVAEVLNNYGKFNAKKWLESEFGQKLEKMFAFAKERIDASIAGFEQGIKKMETKLRAAPEFLLKNEEVQKLFKKIESWKKAVARLKERMGEIFPKVKEKIKELKDRVLKNEEHSTKGGVANGDDQVLKQTKAEPPELPDVGKNRLNRHRADVEAHKKKYEDVLADPNSTPNQKTQAKRNISEANGELATTDFMAKNHPDFEMVEGFSPGTGFDQVYIKRGADGSVQEIMIVEAKGGSSGLSTGAKKGDQMSKPWVKNTVEEMKKSSDPASRKLGQQLDDALKTGSPKVTGKAVSAPGNGPPKELPIPGGPNYN